jgi:NADH-quinone oxidoreductase subunit N
MESRFIDTHFWVTEFEFKDVNSQDFLSNALNCLKLTDFFNINLSELNVVDFNLIYIGFFLICISIFIKLALAPFHLWSLDVYEGSPNSTTAFFAVIPKIALFVLLARLCYSSFYELFNVNYQNYFVFLAVLSIFVGSVGGLEQRNLKTLLAYSSVSHTGYLFLAFNMNTAESFQMMFYYLVIFMISGLCFWSVYLFIKQNQKFYYKKHNKELGDFVLLKESNPTLALILVMTLFSIAGIPPLIGFLAKVGVFLVTIESSAYLVAVISILLSVISTFYYIRMIKVLYFENSLVGKLYYPISTNKALVISFLALSLIILCLNPTFIYLVFYKASLLIYS